jgi:predicted glutamine amidotransferase
VAKTAFFRNQDFHTTQYAPTAKKARRVRAAVYKKSPDLATKTSSSQRKRLKAVYIFSSLLLTAECKWFLLVRDEGG